MSICKLFTLNQVASVAGAFFIAGSGIANAEIMQIGKFYFDLNSENKTAVLTRNEAYTTMTSIEIPATVNDGNSDYSVIGIAQQCFQSCKTMNNIVLPASIQTIGKWAFYECTGLAEINLPESLTTIDELAFQKCSGLTRIELPSNVTAIGQSAFVGCNALTEVVLNDNLTSLPDAVFNGCFRLAKVTLPKKLETLGNNVFYGCALTTVELPATLKSMGNANFSRCAQLTSVTIPGSLKTLGDQTFYECNALTTVTFGEGVETLGEAAFYNNFALKDVVLPKSLKTLKPSAFYGCSSLTKIELPTAITTIPRNCFYDCAGLTTSPINDRIDVIESSAFQNCASLESVILPKNLKTLESNTFSGCSKLKSVKFNDVLEKIDETVFFTNTSLTTVDIPATVTYIGKNPFIGCANLNAINVDDANPNYASPDGVLTDKAAKTIISYPGGKTSWVMPETIEEVAAYSFNNLPNVTDITFSPNIKKIGMSAFYNTKIREAVFTDKLECIDGMAFFMDKGLEKIVFGNSDFTTGNNCLSMTSVSRLLFPESVSSVGVDANGQGFSIMGSNTNITAVWFPSTLKQLSPLGSGCTNLAKIYCWAQTPPALVGSNPITIAPEVFVPKGTADAYREAWSKLYPNVTFKDVLPEAPVLNVNEKTASISWQPFTEEGYIGEVANYSLTLYKGQDENRTEIFTHKLNANGEQTETKTEGSIPQTINASLGSLEVGEYSVCLKGFTSLGEMVMKFEEKFAVEGSGIDDLATEETTPIVFYNLQGIRIDNPEKGNVYISRKGNDAEIIVY